jgi:hypothetical protein
MDLPKGDKSFKNVYLPGDTKLETSTKTKLPFTQLSDGAREADFLPGLKQSLMSVNKMSEEGYTTIFHPGEEGVTVHDKGTLTITMKKTTNPARNQKTMEINCGRSHQTITNQHEKKHTMCIAYHR